MGQKASRHPPIAHKRHEIHNKEPEMTMQVGGPTQVIQVCAAMEKVGIPVHGVTPPDVQPSIIWLPKSAQTALERDDLGIASLLNPVPYRPKGSHAFEVENHTLSQMHTLCRQLTEAGYHISACSPPTTLGNKTVFYDINKA